MAKIHVAYQCGRQLAYASDQGGWTTHNEHPRAIKQRPRDFQETAIAMDFVRHFTGPRLLILEE